MPWQVPEPLTMGGFVRERFERVIKPLLESVDESTKVATLALLQALATEARLKVSGNFQEYAWKLIRPKLEQLKGVVSVRDEVAFREVLYRFTLEARVYQLRES